MIVDLLPTEDQQLIADSVEGFLRDALPVDRLREVTAFGAGHERKLWLDLAGLGLFGLGVAAENCGVGYDAPEETTVCRLFGRYLVSPSVIATMAAAHLATQAGDADLVSALCSGEKRAAFANLRTAADTDDLDIQLIDAEGADLLLLLDGENASLFPSSAARDVTAIDAIDLTIDLRRAIVSRGDVLHTLAGTNLPLRVSILISSYLGGISEAARDMAVDYAKVREQFGQPIGAFQAIKHLCAEMALRSEAAISQTFFATLHLVSNTPEAAYEAACARILAGRAAVENGRNNIQVHGAMGFTQEASAHHFLKRSFVLSAISSTRRQEAATIATFDSRGLE
jgi:alkylation response protein AidB-like acyl-CoA dehydrogenase